MLCSIECATRVVLRFVFAAVPFEDDEPHAPRSAPEQSTGTRTPSTVAARERVRVEGIGSVGMAQE
jgi:hypothetical protein